MIDHQFGHASVDDQILSVDERSLAAAQKENSIGDVIGIAHPLDEMLIGIRSLICIIFGIDPAM